MLNLSWDASPYEINATAPGSALRFDLDDSGIVTANYLFTLFNTTDGLLTSVPAVFQITGSNQIPLVDFVSMSLNAIDMQCTTISDAMRKMFASLRE
jgi:hypothetical protein